MTPEELQAQTAAFLAANQAPYVPAPAAPAPMPGSDYIAPGVGASAPLPPAAPIAPPVTETGDFVPGVGGTPPLPVPAQAPSAPAAGVGWAGGPLPMQGTDPAASVTPGMSDLEADMFARSLGTGGSGMTETNLRASREKQRLDAENVRLKQQMGDRAAALGTEQERIGLENAAQIEQIRGETDAMVQRMEAEEAARRERVVQMEGSIEESRKQWQEAMRNVNPHRLLGSGGNKALFALSTAFGSAGAALGGGQNVVAKQLDQIFEADFNAQLAQAKGLHENTNMLIDARDRFVKSGMEERASRLASRSLAYESLGKYMEAQAARKGSAEEKAAGLEKRDLLYMKANEDMAAAMALAARPSGKSAPTALDRKKAALELQLQAEKLRAAQMANTPGAAPANESALNRRSKLATQAANLDLGTKNLSRALELAEGSVGTIGARAPSLKFGQAKVDADEFNKRLLESITALSAARGGPITESDVQRTEELVDAAKNSYLDETMRLKLRNLITLFQEKRDAVLAGQDPGDVEAIESNLKSQAKPDKNAYRERFVTQE